MAATRDEFRLPGEGLERSRTFLAGCIERGELAGAVALVAKPGRVTQSVCVGMRDIEAGLPMEPDTIFRIASMTKAITSVGALRLVESGRLRLEDPVSRYIPEFADVRAFDRVDDGQAVLAPLERPITILDLFTHTSGIDSDAPDPSLEADFDNLGDLHYDSAELMRRLAAHPLAHQPGAGWRYGWSLAVLGRVIEVIADRPLDAYAEAAILAPLGMVDTGYRVPPDKIRRLAAVYLSADGALRRLDDADTREIEEPPSFASGSSGLASTAPDFTRFARMLLRGGELDGVRLLAPETVARMTRNHVRATLCPIDIWGYASRGEGYGLGVGVSIDPPAPRMPGSRGTYGWAGSWGTRFWIDPVTRTAGIFMGQFQPFAFVGPGEGFWSLVCESVAR